MQGKARRKHDRKRRQKLGIRAPELEEPVLTQKQTSHRELQLKRKNKSENRLYLRQLRQCKKQHAQTAEWVIPPETEPEVKPPEQPSPLPPSLWQRFKFW